MKKILTLCIGATMLMGTTMGLVQSAAYAQDATTPAATPASGPFADVPADHWAYTAVNTLQKAGIVIGYPDGTYGGRRAMTRYEFAVAIARLLPMIQQIDTSQFVKTGDFQAFQDDVNNKLQAQQAAIDALKALVDEFQPELERLGQDVAAIQKRLDDDEARLAAVEEEQKRLKITGDINFVARGNVNTSSTKADPLDENGYRIGSTGNKSLWSNINVYHDILLTFDGRVSDDSHVIVKLDASNFSNQLGSWTSDDPLRDDNSPADGGAGGSADTFSIYEAYLDTPVDLGVGSGGDFEVGRFGNQFTPYTLKAINPDLYTSLPETSTGDIPMDGAKVSLGVGGAHVELYGAKDAPVDFVSVDAGPSTFGRSGPFRPGSNPFPAFGTQPGGENFPSNPIDQSAGARVTLGSPDTWTLGLTGLIAREAGGIPTTDPFKFVPYNNVAVYGADFNGWLPFMGGKALTLNGEVAVNPTGFDSRFGNVNSHNGNEAWQAELGYTFDKFNLKGGYQEVYTNFNAPGYWGTVGDWTNPTNVKGPIVNASYAVTPTLSIVGDGHFYQGGYDTGIESPLGKNDKVNNFDVGVKYALTSQYGLDLGYQWVGWDLQNDQHFLTASGKPTEQYITLGVGHSFNANSSLKLLYQIINYQDKGTGFDPAGDSEGGVALTQFSLKF